MNNLILPDSMSNDKKPEIKRTIPIRNKDSFYPVRICVLCKNPKSTVPSGMSVKVDGVFDMEPCEDCMKTIVNRQLVGCIEAVTENEITGEVIIIHEDVYKRVISRDVPSNRLALVETKLFQRAFPQSSKN